MVAHPIRTQQQGEVEGVLTHRTSQSTLGLVEISAAIPLGEEYWVVLVRMGLVATGSHLNYFIVAQEAEVAVGTQLAHLEETAGITGLEEAAAGEP